MALERLFKIASVTSTLMSVKTGVMLFLHPLSQSNYYFAALNTFFTFYVTFMYTTPHFPLLPCCKPLIIWKQLAG